MGVDDIIERNRVAAGLKPRDMRKDTSSMGALAASSAAEGEGEEEETIGSRVYLPSRTEQQEEFQMSMNKLASNTSVNFDPDEHPEEIIPDLDIDTIQRIHNLGWRFALKEDVARRMKQGRGSNMDGKEARLSPSDITSEDLVLESIILDKNGEPTERWTISGRDWVGDYPTMMILRCHQVKWWKNCVIRANR